MNIFFRLQVLIAEDFIGDIIHSIESREGWEIRNEGSKYESLILKNKMNKIELRVNSDKLSHFSIDNDSIPLEKPTYSIRLLNKYLMNFRENGIKKAESKRVDLSKYTFKTKESHPEEFI